MQRAHTTASVVDGAPRCELGESPRWDPVGRRLYWVDLLAGLVHALDPATGRMHTVDVGRPVSALARHADGWVVGVETGVQWRDATFELVREVALPVPGRVRLNDGELDPAGRFLVGSLSYDGVPGLGALFQVDPSGEYRVLLHDLDISNGIAFTADGRTMYHVDSGPRLVRRYGYDPATGALDDGVDFYEHPNDGAVPDGVTLDAAGGLWVALWGGGRVVRLDPDGRTTAAIDVEATQPSSVEFGGPYRDVLYITSARDGLPAGRLTDADGLLYAARPDVPGAAQKLVRLTPTTRSESSTRNSAR